MELQHDVFAPLRQPLGESFLPRGGHDRTWKGTPLRCGNGQNAFSSTLLNVLTSTLISPLETNVRAAIAGRVMVDLACGAEPEVAARHIQRSGASGYVGVDLFRPNQILRTLSPFPAAVVQYDALAYLKRLESGSCNIMINAFDIFVLNDPRIHCEIAREMLRVCAPGGMVMGVASDSIEHLKVLVRHILDWTNLETESVYQGGIFLRLK